MRKSRARPKTYRSKFEETIARQLTACGVKWTYESEKLNFTSAVRGGSCRKCGGTNVEKRRKYTPDFVITTKGKKVYLETKGRLTSQDRTKMIDVLRCNPKITLVMVFMRDNNVRPGLKYSDWCKKNGINYCIKEVESKWLTC